MLRRSHGPESIADAPFVVLEPRTLLDATFSGTDNDGDTYTVTLQGPGDLDVQTTGADQTGSIASITVTGSSVLSTISISVNKAGAGNGRVALGGLVADDLAALLAPAADLTAGSVSTNSVGTLSLGDVLGGAIISDNADATHVMTMSFRRISTPPNLITSIATVGQIATFSAVEFTGDGAIEAAALGVLTIAGGGGSPGDFDADLTLAGSPGLAQGLGKAKIAGTISGQWTIPAGAGPVEAAALSGAQIVITGPLASLKTRGTLDAQLTAVSFGVIQAVGPLTGSISFSGADAKGIGLKSLKAPSASDLTINGQPAAGRIESIAIAGAVQGSIVAPALGTLSIKGGAALNLSLTGLPGQTTLKRASLGADLVGTWTLTGDAGAISVKGIANGWEYNSLARIGSVSIGGSATNFSLTADTLGALSVKGPLQGVVDLNGQDSKGVTAGSIKVGGAADVQMEDIPGRVGSLTALSITGLISLGTLGTLRTTGSKTDPGDANGLTLLVGGADSKGLSLGRLDVKGSLQDSRVTAVSNIGAVLAGRIIGSVVAAGTTDALTQLPGDLTFLRPNLPATQGVIASVGVRQKFDLGIAAFTSSVIAARILNSVSIAGRAVSLDTGTPFGFAADTIKSISMKTPAGGGVSFKNLANPEVLFPIGSPSDIRIAVL